jgi:hypothetical protein
MENGYYTVGQASKKLKITRQAVHFLINNNWKGKCKYETAGGFKVWLIPKELVDSHIPRSYPKKP